MPHKILANQNIKQLLLKLSIPAMVGMLVMATYNVVDAIFIGRGVGTLAIAGIMIVAPFQILVFAIATMFGIGGASIFSRLLGAKRSKLANIALTNTIKLAIFFGLSLSIVGYFFIEEILIICGVTDATYQYAKDYISILIFGFTPLVFVISYNNLIRAEGKAKTAMVTMMVSALINVILDPIFIFYFHMGIKGAAYATIIAEIFTCIYLSSHFVITKSKRDILDVFRFHRIGIRLYLMREIFTVGATSFVNQICASVMILVLNKKLAIYGGDLAISVFTIFMRTSHLIFMPVFGIAQGMQPIAGYNYGAKNYNNTKKVIFLAIRYGTYISIFGFILLFFFPKFIVTMFTNDPTIVPIGIQGLKTMSIAMPFIATQMVGSVTFQALGKPIPALLLSILRQVLILIPLLLVFSSYLGLFGIWISFPLSDIFSFTITLFLLRNQILKLNKPLLVAA